MPNQVTKEAAPQDSVGLSERTREYVSKAFALALIAGGLVYAYHLRDQKEAAVAASPTTMATKLLHDFPGQKPTVIGRGAEYSETIVLHMPDNVEPGLAVEIDATRVTAGGNIDPESVKAITTYGFNRAGQRIDGEYLATDGTGWEAGRIGRGQTIYHGSAALRFAQTNEFRSIDKALHQAATVTDSTD